MKVICYKIKPYNDSKDMTKQTDLETQKQTKVQADKENNIIKGRHTGRLISQYRQVHKQKMKNNVLCSAVIKINK